MARTDSITACAIVKDELPYMLEWIAWYRLLGFDRVLIYSNDCSDGTDRLLDTMQAEGLVEHRAWPSRPGLAPQQTAYADALRVCPTRWILFADADEFLHIRPRHAHEGIHDFLSRFADDVSAIAISWRLFGSAGREDYDPRPVTERFTRAAPAAHHLNRHVKTMAVAADIAVAGIHGVILRHGRYVMPNGEDVVLHRHAFAPPQHDVAQINHYVVKSRDEFSAKKKRGIATLKPEERSDAAMRDDDFFASHDRNEEEERSFLVHLPALKAEMARIRRALIRRDPGLASLLPVVRPVGPLRALVRRASGWWRHLVRQPRSSA